MVDLFFHRKSFLLMENHFFPTEASSQTNDVSVKKVCLSELINKKIYTIIQKKFNSNTQYNSGRPSSQFPYLGYREMFDENTKLGGIPSVHDFQALKINGAIDEKLDPLVMLLLVMGC